MQANPTVFIVEDDQEVQRALIRILEQEGLECLAYSSATEFLADLDRHPHESPRCLILDVYLPGMSGLELLTILQARRIQLPVIVLSGYADVPMVVAAMKGGAFDFLEKPLKPGLIVDCVRVAIERNALVLQASPRRDDLSQRLKTLTPREQGVLELMVAGRNNKQIAQELAISIQTAAKHTSRVLGKMNVQNAVELTRILELLPEAVRRSAPAHS